MVFNAFSLIFNYFQGPSKQPQRKEGIQSRRGNNANPEIRHANKQNKQSVHNSRAQSHGGKQVYGTELYQYLDNRITFGLLPYIVISVQGLAGTGRFCDAMSRFELWAIIFVENGEGYTE